MKPILRYESTVKDVLNNRPKGSYVYRIYIDINGTEVLFYLGITLSDLVQRFRAHVAKVVGEYKNPDKPKCMEMEYKDSRLTAKCVGRDVDNWKDMRELLKKYNIDVDILECKVIVEQFTEDRIQKRGEDFEDAVFTNQGELEWYEIQAVREEKPLTNDIIKKSYAESVIRKCLNLG